MSALLVTNGTLVSLGLESQLLPSGALLIDRGVIAAMGSTAALRAAYPAAEIVDARGSYIMPGMICAHTHTYGAFVRGMALKDAPPRDFTQILERLWWRLDRALTPADVTYSALVCLIDATRHGVTTLIDHHASPNACAGSLDLIAAAFEQAGLRGCLCYEVSDREGPAKAKAGIRENERFVKLVRRLAQDRGRPKTRFDSSVPPSPLPSSTTAAISPFGPSQGEGARAPLLAGMMGLHAAFTLSDETLAEAASVAHDLGVGCHIHVAEGRADGRKSEVTYRERTVQRLQRLGVLGPQTIAAHCIHIDDNEMALLAESGTMVVHNPRSNMNNAVGTAPVGRMIERGILVGLGNDGFSNDMFVEMKAAYLAHKAANGDPQAMPADMVQTLAIANNARIASTVFAGQGCRLRFGELAVGAPADVIVADYHSPTPVTAGNLPWHLIFGIDGGMVTTTIAAGRLLMHDRQLTLLDEGRIYSEARRLAAALWERF